MTNEIKEILNNPKILMLSYGNYISLDDYVKLKDCITNLQQRIDKAIEYINYVGWTIQVEEEYLYSYELDFRDKILNILRGDE